jgi:hypothetical protein
MSTATLAQIDEPGFYPDLSNEDYQSDALVAPELGRTLSSSGVKRILDLPARFAWERENGRAPKDAFDLGSTAHAIALRNGKVHVVDAYDWRGKADQATKKRLRAEGKVVVHRGEFKQAAAMARAVRLHPLAGAILSQGRPEVSYYWTDPETGVTCRARADWLREGTGADCIADLKTAQDASADGFGKSIANFGYALSAVHYLDGYEALTGRRIPFYLIAVETAAPHFVQVHEIPHDWLEDAAEKVREARALFAHCESTGQFPGYAADQIVTPTRPRWA